MMKERGSEALLRLNKSVRAHLGGHPVARISYLAAWIALAVLTVTTTELALTTRNEWE